ncbi:hypothetical protein [Nocardia sp. N2S4-5]|uniref:hypothetical protein n=1 Tax=Nocardia sp. N2S4-5 TaxID=3351565 RepID=UPI0037D1C48B
MDAKLSVLPNLGQFQCTPEVAIGSIITSSIMSHPSRHLGQPCRRSENKSTAYVMISPEQPWCYITLQIVDDRGIEMTTAHLPISRTK